MSIDLIISYILIGYGLYALVGVIFKVDFFWNGRAFSQMRALVGDQRARLIYLILALICLGFGAFNVIDILSRGIPS